VGAPYEPPTDADLVLGTRQQAVEDAVEHVLALLVARGVIPNEH
jgi:adenylylsulfate kinase-like enzyme